LFVDHEFRFYRFFDVPADLVRLRSPHHKEAGVVLRYTRRELFRIQTLYELVMFGRVVIDVLSTDRDMSLIADR
jgi:hypothetical protein